MIRDLDSFEGDSLPTYDLCVVGSGPAGTTLAAELSGQGLAVCVLESGSLTVTAHADALRPVASEGIYIKDYSRERVLGGASTTWGGLAAPLDEIDFAPRPWLDHSGWPIPRAELSPHWEAAARRYRFPHGELFGASGGFAALRSRSELQPRWAVVDEKIFLAAAEAQNFGREWRHVYEDEGTDAWLDATVVSLASEGDAVRAARVRTRSGRDFELRARAFVLATGGLENARLLLNSTDGAPAGLGNEHDQVGRYLMNHPKNYHGMLSLARPTGDLPYYYGCLYKGFAGYAGLRLGEDYQAQHQLLNSYVRLEPLFPWTDNRGVEALVLFAKHSAFLMKRWKGDQGEEVVALRDYSETGDDSQMQNERKSLLDWLKLALYIPLDLPSVLRYLKYRLITKAKPRITRVRLRNFMEMEPHPENRVVLTEERDALGARKSLVRHDSTAKDRAAVIELHRVLKREFEEQGWGTLYTNLEGTDAWPIDEEASHHLGTTRMGTDPRSSVVDVHQRVHSLQNLYVAGGSVFPTSGCANPTYTIVALSIRLAQHLARELKPGAEEVAP